MIYKDNSLKAINLIELLSNINPKITQNHLIDSTTLQDEFLQNYLSPGVTFVDDSSEYAVEIPSFIQNFDSDLIGSDSSSNESFEFFPRNKVIFIHLFSKKKDN